jgi:predicted MFS family arabinose efflux permease
MMNFLAKLGQDPQRSLSIFLRGLGFFVVGLLFIAFGYFNHHLWQVFGIIIIAVSCLIAAWGYLGIFANRWFNILDRRNSHHKK